MLPSGREPEAYRRAQAGASEVTHIGQVQNDAIGFRDEGAHPGLEASENW